MNKAQLIDAVALSADLPKILANKTLNAVLDSITEALVEGDCVSLVGFGTFTVKTRVARIGRNPKTGVEIQINEAKVPTFKAGKVLKKAVSQSCVREKCNTLDV